jgi:hypothetical protein
MQTITGYQLDTFPLQLRGIVDLIYFDGPLLTLFENEYGDYYLYYWCDTDSDCHRWLVFRVTRLLLRLYVTQKLSLRELILKPVDGFLYAIDLDDNLQGKNICLVHPNHLPQVYVPGEDSYYNFADLDGSVPEAEELIWQSVGGKVERHQLGQNFNQFEPSEPILAVLGALVANLINLKKASELMGLEPDLLLKRLELMGIQGSYLKEIAPLPKNLKVKETTHG